MRGRIGQESSPSQRLLEKYITISRLHRSYLEERLRRTGVYRSQHQILMCIHDYPGSSQKDIACMYQASPATVAVSLKKLEKGGYIKRDVDEGDNRFNQIRITEKGETLIRQSICLFDRLESAMFQGFTEEDFAGLEGYLDRIRCNMTSLMNEKEREEPT